VEELDKLVIFVNNDVMIFEKGKVSSSKFQVGYFKFGAYNWLQEPNHSLGGYSYQER
jgi:hypothetical protein